jgi:hypothetical protein
MLMAGSCCHAGRHRAVTGEEFLELAGSPLGSAYHVRFIGATQTRAYLSVWSALPSSVGGGEDVCSVALAHLPRAIVDRILAGANPWAK